MENDNRPPSAMRWWPNFLGGLALPFASIALRKWLHPSVAAAVAFIVLFGLVGLVYLWHPPTNSWRSGNWFSGALLGAVVYGVLTYVLPWG